MKCSAVFIGLGGNVGDRGRFLRRAAAALKAIFHDHGFQTSRVYETSPVGPKQRQFLNAVVKGYTKVPPRRLLAQLKAIEKSLGRRPGKKWGPRSIDLDILFYGARRVRTAALTIPHRELSRRKFVIAPLRDIAPRLRHPQTGKSVTQMARELTDPSQSIKLFGAGKL
jgi:2-amino-4-hydroxy-6-hydroxymethyldihydropteridine diphosphokinase